MMNIRLQNVVPAPLAEWDNSQSEVWASGLELLQGEMVQVVAPSGKGKSTLLNIIYGNRTDYTGELLIDGRPVSKFTHAQWANLRQKHVSMVFQDLRLFPDFTGWENLYLKLRLTNHYNKADVEAMATRLGVHGLLKKKCGFMSFGERQRVAIIRSLLQPFDWILLDEPFSHLDQNNIKKAAELIMEEVTKRRAGVLIASLGADSVFDNTRKIQL